MEDWKLIKEEPEDEEYHEAKSAAYCDEFLDSCSKIKSKEECEDEIEIGEEFYTAIDSQESCVKIESQHEIFNTEENNNQSSGKTASSYGPKLSIPLVRLECSQNQEVIKYLKPLLPAISSSTKLQSGNETIKGLKDNLKTESVELETLTENTLAQSSKNHSYASPWDFVSVANRYDENSLLKNGPKRELADVDCNGDYESEFSKSFICKSLLPEYLPNVENKSFSKRKLTQTTLNFEVVSAKHMKNKNAITESPMQTFSFDSLKHIGELQPPPLESSSPPLKFLSCESCDQKFIRKSNLIRHRQIKHSNEGSSLARTGERLDETVKKISCKVCGKSFRTTQLLRRHRPTHDPTTWVQCDICEKKFKMKRYLRQHIQIHNVNYYSCDYCPRIYTHKATLRRHMVVHNAGDEKIEKSIPQKHIPQVKSKKPNIEKVLEPKKDAPLKLYECDVCGKRFEDKSSMKIHIEFLHIELVEEHADKLMPQSSKSHLEKPYQCRTCNRRYTQLSHLYRHQKSHSTKKSHLCKQCNWNFTTTSSLSRHIINVHNEVPQTRRKAPKITTKDFRCKICGKAFRNSADLRRHCAIHDERKPYECDTCKKQFAVKGYLYAHVLTHDNWKPYPCQSCTKVYRRKSSLQRHVYLSHAVKCRFECSICVKSWKHEVSYRKHMESSHLPNSNA